jgi:hypothetical protein
MTRHAIARSIARAFATPPRETPYRHWILGDILPDGMAAALAHLPLAGQPTGEGAGRRETHKALRVFFNPSLQAAHPLARDLAAVMQSPGIVAQLSARCATALAGTMLRIEYCRDRHGFWLEPHTDIGAKRFTFLIYLNTPPDGEDWGTDLYDATRQHAGTAPAHENAGLAFIPAADTWHGFRPRPITGLRRTLIINYVVPDWRSTHELAFPGEPVAGA